MVGVKKIGIRSHPSLLSKTVVFTMVLIIDLQGFKVSVIGFRVKELAVISLDEEQQPSNFLFQPAFNWNLLPAKQKSENLWLERNFHGLMWDSGDVPYKELGKMLSCMVYNNREIYVKGLQKKEWLESILEEDPTPRLLKPSVIDLLDLGCPSLEKLRKASTTSNCTHHNLQDSNCAAQNVILLRNWLLEHRSLEKPSYDTTDICYPSTTATT